MKLAALDLSLTATGVATSEGVVTCLRPSTRAAVRLDEIEREVLRLVAGARLVVIEGYAFSARNSRSHATGELGGVIRLWLWRARIGFVTIAPAAVKKYATGKGNAPKEAVLAAAIRCFGFDGTDHNEADALVLLKMALDHYGLPGAVDVPKTHREALKKVKWPDIGVTPRAADLDPQPELVF